ncbi:ribosomal protein S5 domain 2-type protein [Scenedesmus sp. NREL 46B-D3]|nr:ribosomal protein S5 domain 2-type protein [Scenedesmus sp. NREL 46B-D3]
MRRGSSSSSSKSASMETATQMQAQAVPQQPHSLQQAVTSRVYARIGLLGNPSDGFYGKTISCSLANFYAEVTLTPTAAGASFQPHPQHDPCEFDSLSALVHRLDTQGYYGGIRLLMALCKRFHAHCSKAGLQLPAKGFQLSYDTNIPRQAGLSGSSAIICAGLNCLLQYFQVPQSVLPVQQQPSLILSAEAELGITAGLQDRVIQVYGGVVCMDFDQQHMEASGCGIYESLDPALLPRLWLVWCDNPSDSGRLHSTVKQRWLAGDAAVREGMQRVAECAEQGRAALLQQDTAALAQLMDANFNLRRWGQQHTALCPASKPPGMLPEACSWIAAATCCLQCS